MINDSEVGEAFLGMAISQSPGTGNVLLWNPWESGKLLYVDRLIIAGSGVVGADVRYCKATFGTLFPDHVRSKRIDGAPAVAKIYTAASNPPSDYPYNRPVQEIWLGGTFNDRAYPFDPAIVVPQGRGVMVGMSGDSAAIASFQWREKTDPLGAVSAGGAEPGVITGGTVHGINVTNPAGAFDGDEASFANDPTDGTNTNYALGKIWSASKTLARFIVKSPSGRSFSAANPGRLLNWVLEKWDGSTWTSHQSGTYTEPGTGSTQSVIDVTLSTPCTALGHRVRISESAVSSQRVAEVVFYS